jgi:FkbM family methyltransferase
MQIAKVQGVEWKISDEAYEWSTRPSSIEIGPQSIWEWHPIIGAELKSFRHVCEQLQPSTFIDIGAHTGIFSSVYCSIVNDHICHSIEPIHSHMDRLKETSELNNWNLTTHMLAMNNYVGETYYHNTHMAMFITDSDYVVADKFINGNAENAKVHKTLVTTLDAFVNENQLQPNLIKIDIEGYEVPVLEQSYETLNNFAVNLFIETHRDECINLGWDVREICKYLDNTKYSFYTIDLSQKIDNLKEYVTNHESNMRFIAINKMYE